MLLMNAAGVERQLQADYSRLMHWLSSQYRDPTLTLVTDCSDVHTNRRKAVMTLRRAIAHQGAFSLTDRDVTEHSDYVITADNLLKLVSVQFRLQAGIRCAYGETGRGKQPCQLLDDISAASRSY